MKTKITILEAARLAACRTELSLSRKIARALGARRINFDRLHRMQVEQLAAIRQIGATESAIRQHEFAEFLCSIITTSLAPVTTTT